MPEIKPKFTGIIDGHELKKGEWIDLPEKTISKMSKQAYRTRPFEAKQTRPLRAESELKVVQAGAWWQVWRGDEKLKSFRSEEEAKAYDS